jgi:hypothetical protein
MHCTLEKLRSYCPTHSTEMHPLTPSCIQTLHIGSFIRSVRLSTDTENTLDMQSRDIKMRSVSDALDTSADFCRSANLQSKQMFDTNSVPSMRPYLWPMTAV